MLIRSGAHHACMDSCNPLSSRDGLVSTTSRKVRSKKNRIACLLDQCNDIRTRASVFAIACGYRIAASCWLDFASLKKGTPSITIKSVIVPTRLIRLPLMTYAHDTENIAEYSRDSTLVNGNQLVNHTLCRNGCDITDSMCNYMIVPPL